MIDNEDNNNSNNGSPNIEIGTNPHISSDPQGEPPNNWRDKLRAAINSLKQKLSGSSQRRTEISEKSGFATKLEQWQIRERIAKLLPNDLAKSFPRSLEPLALAEWASQAFQKEAVSFYGKGATILLCAYFLADITSLLVEKYIPDPPIARAVTAGGSQRTQKSVDAYEVIASRNLFDSSGKGLGDDQAPPTEDLGPPQKTGLPLSLIGTLILRDELKSIATIEDKSSGSVVYPVRMDDEIPSKARIVKIEPRRVIFINTSNNRREYVELPEDLFAQKNPVGVKAAPSVKTGIEQSSPTHFNLDRKFVDKTLQDLSKVLTEARAVPNFENGQPAGYKLFQIVPGSIFDALGLKNGDTIAGLNGAPINDPGKAFEMLGELKTAKNLELQIKRDGKTQNFNYDIRDR